MSLELGLFIILFAGIVLNEVIEWQSATVQDERIKQLDDHNDWQDSERARLRERIVELEKRIKELDEWKDDFKKELIQRRREIDWLKTQVVKLQAEKKEAQNGEQETPEESEVEND